MAASNSPTRKPAAKGSDAAPPEGHVAPSVPEASGAPDASGSAPHGAAAPIVARDGTPPADPPRGGGGAGGGSSGAAPPGGPSPPGPPPLLPGVRRVWVTNRARGGLVGWLLRWYAFAAILLLLGVGLSGIATYRYFASELPPLSNIERYDTLAPGVTRIFAGNGAMIAELAREHRAYARYEEIPEPLVHAFLAAEDRRFFEHGGLDYRGLARAVIANYRSGTISQGGSTITQQVAKGFLGDEQTIARKAREAILSVRMESRLTKEQILEIYLNKIFLGHGAYGVGAAASRYFGKKLDELTLAESALIAGMARAPSRYSPVSHPERAKERRAVVLQDMVEAGYIQAEERDAAIDEEIRLVEVPDVFRARAPYYAEEVRRRIVAELGEPAVLQDGLQIETAVELQMQQMAEEAVDEHLRKLDHRHGWRGPVSHLDGDAARTEFLKRTAAEYGKDPLATDERWRLGLVAKLNKFNAWVRVGDTEAVLNIRGMKWASRYDRNSGENEVTIDDVTDALEEGDVIWVRRADEKKQAHPPSTSRPSGAGGGDAELDLVEVDLGQTPRVEAALYTVDHETGYVEAVQGGHDYDRSQFNRAVQGCRQPGSVFKAIYYAYALDTGKWSMGSVLEDRAYEPEPDEEWNPQNLHGTIEGKVLLRNAFIHSLNLPSIRLFVRLGADNVVAWARRLGFTTELIADKALSLGASCVRMDELTHAFSIYVREGRSFTPTYARRVTDKNGHVVLDRRHPWDGAMDVAGRLDAMGRLGVDPPTQAIDRRTAYLITHMMRDVVTGGIGGRARKVDAPVAGKSGTASENKFTTDTWFAGFTSRYATTAWMGDDVYERSMGDVEASYTTATPMFTDYMAEVVQGIPHREVPVARPPGVHPRMVAFTAGEMQRSALLYFRDGAKEEELEETSSPAPPTDAQPEREPKPEPEPDE
jgi:penicillin-binding protein 1A